MNNPWLQGVKDGEQWFTFQTDQGNTIDQLQAINIVRTLYQHNTEQPVDYWYGYLDGLNHYIDNPDLDSEWVHGVFEFQLESEDLYDKMIEEMQNG